MGLTGIGTRQRRNRPHRLMFFSIMLILSAVFLFLQQLIVFSQQEARIPENVIVGDVDVGGLLPSEAQAAWVQTYAQPIVLYYQDSPIMLDPASVGFRVNWQAMLADAQGGSDDDGNFWIRFFNYLTDQDISQATYLPLSADYQENLLRQFLQDISQRYDQLSGTAGYDVQTLTTFSGSTGLRLDMDGAVSLIDIALRDPNKRAVQLPLEGEDSDRPGLETLRELIIAYLDSQGFIYNGQTTVASIFIQDLQTGEEINILQDVAFTAASTIKIGILVDYFRFLNREPNPDEAWLMANSLLCSRNISSNLLMQIIGNQDIFSGLAQINETLQLVGATNSFIIAPFIDGSDGQILGSIAPPPTNPNPNFNTNPDPFNQTTTEDLGTVFSMIYDCANYGSGLMSAYPAGEFTQQECRQMLELMSANDLYRLLQGGIPEGERISHKNGWLADVVGDVGIVEPANGRDYVIGVYLWEEAEFQDFQRLWPLVEGISRAAWNYFSPENPLLAPRTLPPTAVECEGNYLPPSPNDINLNNIRAWMTSN